MELLYCVSSHKSFVKILQLQLISKIDILSIIITFTLHAYQIQVYERKPNNFPRERTILFLHVRM